MVEFCCYKMKDHSYFLLINYITSIIFGASLEGAAYFSIVPDNLGALQYIYVLLTIVFVVINVIAFFHYVFADDVYSSFHKFYITYQVIFIVVTLGWIVLGIIAASLLAILATFDVTVLITLIISGFVGLALLTFLLIWSIRLRKVIYQTLDEEDELEDEGKDIEANLVGQQAEKETPKEGSVKIKQDTPEETSEKIVENEEEPKVEEQAKIEENNDAPVEVKGD